MSNWWYSSNRNQLEGIPLNFMVDFLNQYPKAQADFKEAFDALTDVDRKDAILRQLEGVTLRSDWRSLQDKNDDRQHAAITAGVGDQP
jgi:hypothetical protein